MGYAGHHGVWSGLERQDNVMDGGLALDDTIFVLLVCDESQEDVVMDRS